MMDSFDTVIKDCFSKLTSLRFPLSLDGFSS